MYEKLRAGQKKHYEYCFMKQRCQIQMVTLQYENVATPLSIIGINTTHQDFQMSYVIFFHLKGLKIYQLK